MKKLYLIIICLSLSNLSKAQKVTNHQYAVPSVTMDTLYVTKCYMGDLFEHIWKVKPLNTNPLIIRVNNIEPYRSKYLHQFPEGGYFGK